jgi:hypothetical protein
MRSYDQFHEGNLLGPIVSLLESTILETIAGDA